MLYNWFAVIDERGLPPKGFRIPSQKDWSALIDFCGGENIAAINLKSCTGWIEPQNAPRPTVIIPSEIGNGSDKFDFNAKPMGALVKTNLFAEFFGFGSDAYFWLADTDEFYRGYAINVYMYYYSSRVVFHSARKRLAMPLRCIQTH